MSPRSSAAARRRESTRASTCRRSPGARRIAGGCSWRSPSSAAVPTSTASRKFSARRLPRPIKDRLARWWRHDPGDRARAAAATRAREDDLREGGDGTPRLHLSAAGCAGGGRRGAPPEAFPPRRAAAAETLREELLGVHLRHIQPRRDEGAASRRPLLEDRPRALALQRQLELCHRGHAATILLADL